MLELQGKFGTAKVFTDVVDNESISQVINLLNQPYIEGSKVRDRKSTRLNSSHAT